MPYGEDTAVEEPVSEYQATATEAAKGRPKEPVSTDVSVQPDETSWIDPSTGADLRPKIPEGPTRVRPQAEVPTTPALAPTHGEPTPIDVQMGVQTGKPGEETAERPGDVRKYQGPDPETFPSWTEVTQSDTFKNADEDGRLTMLKNYTDQAKQVGRLMAAQNQEDPADNDKALDKFYKRERGDLRGPFGVIKDAVDTAEGTISAFGKGVAKGITNIGVGTALGAKNLLYQEVDNSDIGKLSVDQAKAQREQIAIKKAARE
jgi:hypothetical protein